MGRVCNRENIIKYYVAHVKCRFNFTTINTNIGTRKSALLFLLVILIDLTRHLQLYNVKINKKILWPSCCVTPDVRPYIIPKCVQSDVQNKWDDKNIRRTAPSVVVKILNNIMCLQIKEKVLLYT